MISRVSIKLPSASLAWLLDVADAEGCSAQELDAESQYGGFADFIYVVEKESNIPVRRTPW